MEIGGDWWSIGSTRHRKVCQSWKVNGSQGKLRKFQWSQVGKKEDMDNQRELKGSHGSQGSLRKEEE